MLKKLIYIICLPALLFAVSCKKTYPDYGVTSTVKMSNGWWVTLATGGVTYVGPSFFSTYNTSANADSMYLDDLKNGYGFKCKVKVNYSAATFATTGSANAYYVGTPAFPPSVIITGGKILAKAGHSKAGNVTDSIYMTAVFSDDPGDTWIIAGTARTGLIEDDY